MIKKLRLTYASISALLLLIEILIGLYVHDNFVRPYIGDVLVTILLCCLCRTLIPTGIPALPIYVFIFATLVEVAQYFEIVKLLGLENSAFLSTVIGTSFSFIDIICYGVGCLVFWAIEKLAAFILKKRKSPASSFEIPTWEEIVEHMQGKDLSNFTDKVIRVIPSKDRSKRILILQSKSNYFKTVYEEIRVFDNEEWAYASNTPNRYPAWWETVSSPINNSSFYGTEEDAVSALSGSIEYQMYFS